MKIKGILIFLLLVSVSFSVGAQNRPDRPRRGGFDMEAVKKEKEKFLTEEMGLTDTEAKAFLPLEAEYMEKRFKINRDARHKTHELRQKKEKTDGDYKKITEINLEASKKETELQLEYFKKFGKVLSAEKVEKYRAADLKFKEEMLKRHQNRRGENTKQGNRH